MSPSGHNLCHAKQQQKNFKKNIIIFLLLIIYAYYNSFILAHKSIAHFPNINQFFGQDFQYLSSNSAYILIYIICIIYGMLGDYHNTLLSCDDAFFFSISFRPKRWMKKKSCQPKLACFMSLGFFFYLYLSYALLIKCIYIYIYYNIIYCMITWKERKLKERKNKKITWIQIEQFNYAHPSFCLLHTVATASVVATAVSAPF